jgi:hypothetical protein
VTGSDETHALWSRVIGIADDVIQQRRPAQDAARELDQLRVELVRLEDALRPFVGLAAQWDYDVDRRQEREQEILRAAETVRRNFGA